MIFLLRNVPLPNRINSVKWFSGFWQGGPCFASHYSKGCVLMYKNRRMKYYCAVYTVQCTQKLRTTVPWMHAVTSTPYHDFTQSHQLRTMNERGHINLCHGCTQFADSVKSLSYSLTRGFFGLIAYIHGTELMRFGKVTLRSTRYKNQH